MSFPCGYMKCSHPRQGRFFGGKILGVYAYLYTLGVYLYYLKFRQNPKISKISKLCLIVIHEEVSNFFSEFLFCSKNQRFSIRSTATGRNSTQAYMITLAEAQGAGGSFVHKAPNQKTDMSQKRVDLLSTQMSVDFLSTLDPLAEARGGCFVHKVPNQKKDMTQMRRRLAAVGMDSMVKYNCDDTCYFSNSDSQLNCIYTAYTSLACVAFATIVHCQTLATSQTTT